MTRLMTLSGKQDNIEHSIYYPAGLSDVEAGILFLTFLQNEFQYGENSFGKCGTFDLWCKSKNLVSDVWEGTKSVVSSVAEGTGKIIGSTVRLLTDEEVAQGISKYAAALASGGGTTIAEGGLDSILSRLTGNDGISLANLGNMFKSETGSNSAISSKQLMIGGAAIGGLLIFALLLKK